MTPAYPELERRFGRINDLDDALQVLHWDHATMMPAGGAAARARQMATLDVLRHREITDPALADLLAAAEAESADLDMWQRANLREMRRDWRHANAVPADLVEALTEAASDTEMTWRRARAEDDFATLAPKLNHLLGLVRVQAAAKAEAFGCAPYDALLDAYEPGGQAARIDTVFDALAAYLPGLLQAVLERQAQRPAPEPPQGPFPIARQREVAIEFMLLLGFDFAHGRLDVSAHPFTGGVPDDVRITTRYREDEFASALMAVLHETGHALYERGLPEAWRRQPAGRARGMILHESQSLLAEMLAGRSDEFLRFAVPRLRAAFGGTGEAWTVESLTRFYRRVQPGLIRVEADEVTYPLHVILRYRLERALIAGDLAVADLPGAWRETMQTLLGITPNDDRSGCLQDIHWPSGSFGYFPTYTLGAMAAAQLFAAARREVPDIPAALARGDFGPLLLWLRAQVHARASLPASADDLLQEATGAPLGTDAYKAHLETRYLHG
jgi:carboxypeptidase Taq